MNADDDYVEQTCCMVSVCFDGDRCPRNIVYRFYPLFFCIL